MSSRGVSVPILAALLLAAGALSFGCGQEATVTQAPSGQTADAREAAPPATAESARQGPAPTAGFTGPTPQPTPSPAPVPIRGTTNVEIAGVAMVANSQAGYPCGPTVGYEGGSRDHFLHWTPDGSQLVFDFDENVWAVDREGTRLRSVVDANPGFYDPGYYRDSPIPLNFHYGFHADVSPDGSMIAYSTCRYPNDSPHAEDDPRYGFGYEIAAIGIDGTMRRRLTANWEFFDSHPAWSPDGTRIAFIRSPTRYGDFEWSRARIYTMSADGSGITDVMGDVKAGLSLIPPEWSPDGGRLAFVAGGRLHTVRSDGLVLREIARTTTVPSWSPDGEELAFGRSREWESTIYTAKADGTGLRERWRGRANDYSQPISQVSWSPDGSEFLFVAGGVYVVSTDGSGLRRLLDQPRVWWEIRLNPVISNHTGRTLAAWSPDGSRIAVYYPEDIAPLDHRDSGGQLFTIARDGTDLRILVGPDKELGDRGGRGRRHPGMESSPEGQALGPGAVLGRRCRR